MCTKYEEHQRTLLIIVPPTVASSALPSKKIGSSSAQLVLSPKCSPLKWCSPQSALRSNSALLKVLFTKKVLSPKCSPSKKCSPKRSPRKFALWKCFPREKTVSEQVCFERCKSTFFVRSNINVTFHPQNFLFESLFKKRLFEHSLSQKLCSDKTVQLYFKCSIFIKLI